MKEESKKAGSLQGKQLDFVDENSAIIAVL